MGLNDALDTVHALVKENPLATGAIVAGTAIAAGVGVGAIIAASGNGSGRRKRSKRSLKQDRARISKQPWEQAYQKRKRRLKRAKRSRKKSRSRKGIHYTKNGQPYKIMANGRARFIKKKR